MPADTRRAILPAVTPTFVGPRAGDREVAMVTGTRHAVRGSVSGYATVGVTLLIALGVGLLALAVYRPRLERRAGHDFWKTYRFGFVTFALIFVAFDMEMVFMYPWAVVFADTGVSAFLDMFVFIGLLGGGIAYAWLMGGLEWE